MRTISLGGKKSGEILHELNHDRHKIGYAMMLREVSNFILKTDLDKFIDDAFKDTVALFKKY